MPTYEYQCNACKHTFERFQRMSDAPVRTCPKCGKRKVERLLSASAFHLKGAGWYKDGYSSKKDPSAAGEADAKSEAKSETKSESKPESKSGDATSKASESAAKPAKKKEARGG